ncbi:MAG: purine-nucleoside phosphorylase [Candidatus Xenobia bacterium]
MNAVTGTFKAQVEEALQSVRQRVRLQPEIGVILGSGLGDLADAVEAEAAIPFGDIPHFPVSTVPGHSGTLVMGRLAGRPVAVMRGRVHYYEGYTMAQVTFPVRLLGALGCRMLVVTNASGGISPQLSPGDFVRITDHINFMGDNPLRGPNEASWGLRFPDLSDAYDPELGEKARLAGQRVGVELKEGVFCAMSGPSYETRAEIRMLERVGGDMVGMSTVPEVIVARHMGLRVLGISCVVNVCYGPAGVTHEEVLEMAERNRPRFRAFMEAVLQALPPV